MIKGLLLVCLCLWMSWPALSKSVQKSVGDVLAPGQKWINQDGIVTVEIGKVNKENATVAATFSITRDAPTPLKLPIRGEFDPQGTSIGWVVSFWNDEVNEHAVGVWAGYAITDGPSPRPELVMTSLMRREDSTDTTVGFDRFTLS